MISTCQRCGKPFMPEFIKDLDGLMRNCWPCQVKNLFEATTEDHEAINNERARHTANCTNMDDAELSATILESGAWRNKTQGEPEGTPTVGASWPTWNGWRSDRDAGEKSKPKPSCGVKFSAAFDSISGALKTRWRGSRCDRLFSDVSGRADGIPNQRPESRRTELVFSGASRLASDSITNTEALQPSGLLAEATWVGGLRRSPEEAPPKGLGRDGNKPLMRNRQANELPSPIGYTASRNFNLERSYVIGLMLLTFAFGLAAATWIWRGVN